MVSTGLELVNVAGALLPASIVMLTVGLLACVGPARRALRIQPVDTLNDYRLQGGGLTPGTWD